MKKTKADHYTDKEALEFHTKKKPGKIEIVSSKNMTTKRDLALAYSPGLSEIKAQKEAGKITWDIIDVFAMDTINGCDEGLFVEFDFDKDFPPAPDGTPASEDFFTSMPSKCAVGNILYSWNYAYNVNNVKGTPKTIKDFFNTKKFPGKRAIYSSALTSLEIALAADGVKPGKGGSNIYEMLETEKGKGGVEYWVAQIQPGKILYEMEGVSEDIAREAFTLAAAKLPIATRFVSRQVLR